MDNFSKNLVIVSKDDKIIGSMKALHAHQLNNLTLHRAFSVLLFDSKNRLLLQKRSPCKLVYPECWTNTCCSHPFINPESFTDPIGDCISFAIARLKYELGIEAERKDFKFFKKMLYKAVGKDVSCEFIDTSSEVQIINENLLNTNTQTINLDPMLKAETFGEYEIDYIFFIQKDVEVLFNESEVCEVRFVKKSEFYEILDEENMSPWMCALSKKTEIFDFFDK